MHARPILKALLLPWNLKVSNISPHTSQVAHQAGAYPGFRSMKRLGVFLLSPGWDASPSQGYPQHQIRRYPFIHLGGERHYESEVSCPRTQHNVPGQGSNPERSLAPESSALTLRPPRPHIFVLLNAFKVDSRIHSRSANSILQGMQYICMQYICMHYRVISGEYFIWQLQEGL